MKSQTGTIEGRAYDVLKEDRASRMVNAIRRVSNQFLTDYGIDGISSVSFISMGKEAMNFNNAASHLESLMRENGWADDVYKIVCGTSDNKDTRDEIMSSLIRMYAALDNVLMETLRSFTEFGSPFSASGKHGSNFPDIKYLYVVTYEYSFRVAIRDVYERLAPTYLHKLFSLWETEITDIQTFVSMPADWQEEYWANIVR